MGGALQGMLDNFNNNFQSQMNSPSAQQGLQRYNASTSSSNGAASTDSTAAALEAALVEVGVSASSQTHSTNSDSSNTDIRLQQEATPTIMGTQKITVGPILTKPRPSSCPINLFDDASLIPGMIRRLTNLSRVFNDEIKINFEVVMKEVNVQIIVQCSGFVRSVMIILFSVEFVLIVNIIHLLFLHIYICACVRVYVCV